MKSLHLLLVAFLITSCGGDDGKPGTAGQSGSSCSVTQVSEGAVISCSDGSQAIVLNGKDGKDCSKHHGKED